MKRTFRRGLKYPKLETFRKRIRKYKDYLFTFVKNEYVPPDNNASERAFRVFKIKQKVSGMFKSNSGSQRFAQLHSIVDTAMKNLQSPCLCAKSGDLPYVIK